MSGCYAELMTTVEIAYRYTTPPGDAVALALSAICDVYGIRGVRFEHAARTLCIDYDATRLNAATVTKLVRQAGLEIAEILPLIPPQPAPAEPAQAAAQA